MSRGGEVGPFAWGDDDITLRLGIGEWRKVQEKCDAGPFEIGQRLYFPAQALRSGHPLSVAIVSGVPGNFRIDDVREVLLRALIGGGLNEHVAAKMVRERLDEQMDLKTCILLAYAAVEATLDEPTDDPLGERKAGEVKPKSRSRARKSDSAGSMKSAAP